MSEDNNNVIEEANSSENKAHDNETETYQVTVDEGLHNSTLQTKDEDTSSSQRTQTQSGDDAEDFKRIKKIQNLALAGSICGVISVIIGGVLLSSIGLALGIAALVKYRKLQGCSFDESLQKKLKVSSITSIVISAGALILNFISALVLMPTIMAILEGGDTSSLNSLLEASPSTSSTRSSTWG